MRVTNINDRVLLRRSQIQLNEYIFKYLIRVVLHREIAIVRVIQSFYLHFF